MNVRIAAAIAAAAAISLVPHQALSHDKKDPPKKGDPVVPQTVVHVDRKGPCDGFGRATWCVVGGGAAIYGIARAAGWEGFKFNLSGDGKTTGEVAPMGDGFRFVAEWKH